MGMGLCALLLCSLCSGTGLYLIGECPQLLHGGGGGGGLFDTIHTTDIELVNNCLVDLNIILLC